MIRGEPYANSQLWLIRYKPFPDELLSSWLVRLAHGHGVKVQTFCNKLFGSRRQVWNRDIDRLAPQWLLDELQVRTGTPKEEVRRTTLRHFEGALFENYREAGHLRWIQLLKMYHRKRQGYGQQYCPHCLNSDEIPYFRKTWRLAIKTMCLTHNCMLLDRCPKCDAAVSFHRIDIRQPEGAEFQPLSICHSCGFDLRTAPTVASIIYDPEAFDWMRTLLSKIDNFSEGKLFQLEIKEATLFHHMTCMVSKERPRYHLGQHIANILATTFTASQGKRILIESYPCHIRHQYMQFAAWLLVAPKIRLTNACRMRAIRHNFLLRDLLNPPEWYEDCVNNQIATRARPFRIKKMAHHKQAIISEANNHTPVRYAKQF